MAEEYVLDTGKNIIHVSKPVEQRCEDVNRIPPEDKREIGDLSTTDTKNYTRCPACKFD